MITGAEHITLENEIIRITETIVNSSERNGKGYNSDEHHICCAYEDLDDKAPSPDVTEHNVLIAEEQVQEPRTEELQTLENFPTQQGIHRLDIEAGQSVGLHWQYPFEIESVLG